MGKSLDYVIKNVCIVRHTPPFLFTASLSERSPAVPSPLSERGWLRSTLYAKQFAI